MAALARLSPSLRRWSAAVLLPFFLFGCPPGPAPGPFLYVANFGNNSVTAYLSGASGDAPPFKTYQGPATQLNGPTELALDAQHTLYVTNDAGANPSVTIYALADGGNIPPTNLIQGSSTGLSSPRAVALDQAGNVWVANYGNSTITAYSGSGRANRAPIQTVSIGVSKPVGVAVYSGFGPYNGDLFVLNSGPPGPSITIYSSAGGSPIQTVSGPATQLGNPQGLAVDFGGNIWISEYDANAILFFVGGNQANGNVAPWVTLQGPSTGLSGPKGVFVDSSGKVYVANARNTSITVFDSTQIISRGNSPVPPRNVPPIQVIQGGATQLSRIIGLKVG